MANAYKTYVVAAAAAAASLVPLPGAALQASRPSFAGVWEVVNITPPPKAAANALKLTPVTIRHTPTAIELDSTFFEETRTMKFGIGGTTPDINRTGAQVWTTTTRWEGPALVTSGTITQNTTAGYEEWKFTETRSLDARGRMIVARKHVALDGTTTTGTVEWAKQKAPEQAP